MAWTDRFNQYYQLETKASRDEILGLLNSKIEAARLNTGFSSLFKSPDYKEMTISDKFIIIRPVRFNGQPLGIIDVEILPMMNGCKLQIKLIPEFGFQPAFLPALMTFFGAIIGFIFLSWQKMLDGFMIFGLTLVCIFGFLGVPIAMAINGSRLKSYIDSVLLDLRIPEKLIPENIPR
jgi:hypothetical protein